MDEREGTIPWLNLLSGFLLGALAFGMGGGIGLLLLRPLGGIAFFVGGGVGGGLVAFLRWRRIRSPDPSTPGESRQMGTSRQGALIPRTKTGHSLAWTILPAGTFACSLGVSALLILVSRLGHQSHGDLLQILLGEAAAAAVVFSLVGVVGGLGLLLHPVWMPLGARVLLLSGFSFGVSGFCGDALYLIGVMGGQSALVVEGYLTLYILGGGLLNSGLAILTEQRLRWR